MFVEGKLAVDDRGSVSFVNGASIQGFVRFYIVRNHSARFIRAWHGHQRERKLVTAASGAAIVCCVKVDNWDHPSAELPVNRYVLSAASPSALYIPPGYANGAMSLTDGTTLCYFSNASVDDSATDDFRFPARHWNPWDVVER
jgi:dTDP-4-dehydrorhamnose 3,5-epimerase